MSQDPRPNTLPDFEIRSLLSIKLQPSMKNQPLSNKTHSSSSEGGRDPERNWARCRQRESEKDSEGEAESSCYGTMVLARAVIYRSMSDNSIFITV